MKVEKLHVRDWDYSRLESLVSGLQKKRILVVGDVGLDRYTVGVVERISPEAPVPIVLVKEETYKLGLAANVADNVSALGGTPLLVGVVGADPFASDFKRLLKKSRISDQHLVVDRHRRTVLKERIVSDRQQLLRVDYETVDAMSDQTRERLLANCSRLLDKVDALVFEDYAKGMATRSWSNALLALARKKKRWVSVDPNAKAMLNFYEGSSVLTPNTREAEALAGMRIRDEKSLIEVGKILLKGAKAEHVVITRGKDGMAIFSKGSSWVRLIETYAREVFDVSGAGDTVISVLTLALCAGGTIEEACMLGNLAAGVEVGKRGTATVSPPELLEALRFFSE